MIIKHLYSSLKTLPTRIVTFSLIEIEILRLTLGQVFSTKPVSISSSLAAFRQKSEKVKLLV